MKEISLDFGKFFAVVDDDDYAILISHRWSIGTNGYAQRTTRKKDGCHSILMHREIMSPPTGMEVDHINRNRLDNRRSNLRLCTHSQNGCNKPTQKMGGFRGVSPVRNKWVARIKFCHKNLYLGTFETEIEAARAFDEASEKLRGEFATLNFPK